MDIPERYVPQIMAPLVRSGIAPAAAGTDGGYGLARTPHAMSRLYVIEAADGALEGDRCLLEEVCRVHDAWRGAAEALARDPKRAMFDDLAKREAFLEAREYASLDAPAHPVAGERRRVRE